VRDAVASVDDGGGSSTQAGATRAQFCDDALKHAPGVWKLLALDHIAHRDGGRSGHPARAPAGSLECSTECSRIA
jgi:hypothetical protein